MSTDVRNRLRDLIEYVEELVKQAEKPIFALSEYKSVLYYEDDLKGRAGIHHDLQDEDGPIWLKIERLRRNDPPPVPEPVRGWLTVSRDPFREPAMEAMHVGTMRKDEAAELIAKGLVAEGDVEPTLKSGQSRDHVDVIMRLERFPEIKAAIEHYCSGPWREWADVEKPRRRTIAIYDALFGLQQVIQSDPEHPVEIVWGIGVSRWKVGDTEIDHPLIEQLVELDIESNDAAIRFRPRAVEPQMSLRPFFELDNDGAPRVLEFGKQFLAQMAGDKELSPFRQDTFEPVLRQSATQLDTRGVYYPDQVRDMTDRTLPTASENLIVSDTWAIYARRRSGNVVIDDLGRLKDAVEHSEELPPATARLVTEPSSVRPEPRRLIDVGGPDARGSGEGSARRVEQSDEPEDFFFPKPFNDEQIAIIKRLETADGMVVQGPPGTGKTHTIANIICHCLATGKRVLVTSKAAEPLVEVRNHIPVGIRDLVISLLSTEREGLRQLEQAVRILSNTAVRADENQLKRAIDAGQRRVAELRKKIEKIDDELHAWAEKHLTKVNFGKANDDARLSPAELAERVVREQHQHSWLTDRLDLDAKYDPRFTDEDVASARAARAALGADLSYLGKVLPSMADMPDAATIAALHQDLVEAAQLEQRIARDSLPKLSMTEPDAATRAENLLARVERIIDFFGACADEPWLSRLFALWRREGLDSDSTRLFDELIPTMSTIAERRPDVLRAAVRVPDGADKHAVVVDAVEKAAQGKRPFGRIPVGKAEARALVQQIEIQGRQPESVEDWQSVAVYLAWRREISTLSGRWAAIREEFELPNLNDEGDRTGKWIADALSLVNSARRIIEEDWPQISSEVKELFPHGLDSRTVIESNAGAIAAADAIRLNLSKIRLAGSRAARSDLIRRWAICSGSVADEFKAFLKDDLANPDRTGGQIGDRWEALCRELTRIHALRPRLQEVERVASSIQECGGSQWAQQLRTQPANEPDDPLTPGAWRESWQWARICEYLRQIDGRDRIRELSRLRLQYEDDCGRAFGEVVRLRTDLGLKRNLTDRVQAALIMFMQALGKIGAGTGTKKTPLYRRFARQAMEQCYAAVPCWIMPTWRVSESLPAEIGSFDLVIVDEASQSDVAALPALMRGKKLLIVGDDKQVSPTGAFLSARALLQLQHTFLKSQPFAQLLLPGSSIYDLAGAMFPGTRIMLREHFRCVEPIIRFSFQFYPEEIIPLRIPKPSERLDPPLIDVYLPHGRKDRRKVNRVEADAIVDEIETIVKHPNYANRTIGVVSLIGGQQAHLIQQQLLERIGEETFLRHKIACGDSATFQGKERDIMFISMVSSPGDGALIAQVFQQRFNVALSRARDRMYLFRSIAEAELRNPNDLRLKAIRHFRDPMPKVEPVGELIDLCESGFERDVFKRLAGLGYCVTPQVAVGTADAARASRSWHIDLVVEGENDRRLAIELDGEKSHPPEQWLDDMRRQRTMERMGWRFWRCWASSFTRDPDGCMADLVSTLTPMGIAPMAIEARKDIFTEHRTVEANEPRTSDREPTSTTSEPVVEIGDRVLIAYDDSPGRAVLVVAAEQHDPEMGIFKSSSPTGTSVLGKSVDDEVVVSVGDQSRSATILAIEKRLPTNGRAETRVAREQPTTPNPVRTPERGAATIPVRDDEAPKRPPEAGQRSDQSSRMVGPSAPGNGRVLNELRALDQRLDPPQCGRCGGSAQLAITNEGIVIHCQACKTSDRVPLDVLQRLADKLAATCKWCGGPLTSTARSFGHILRCQGDCPNNTWDGISRRMGNP